ncbi:hypothetical protein [Burkholderia glumae]|nr:hypothetical protein [Burkholderia glumae]MCM2495156.1 hypothetical protein [Burkholderia glumae]MCM2546020.1 hypothetical protein [Burkholderia glumae]MCQ0033202.1 hypothetical protein [Burkholderia glumae]MCQ0036562.1 hypothetical protein [Burkholderia glumae]MCR1768008.1 hypothetical protein [Burkholderia glumae]
MRRLFTTVVSRDQRSDWRALTGKAGQAMTLSTQTKESIMPDEIMSYPKNVFTNDGQSDVGGFAKKLALVAQAIRAAGTITVYYGFHGDHDGNFSHPFTREELDQSLHIASAFPNAIMVQVSGPTDRKIEYAKHNEVGQALFTWCDSDTYIKDNKLLPDIIS